MQKTGFDLPTETIADMFIKGMVIKDDGRVFKLDREQVRIIESELVIKERIQAVKAKKEADLQLNQNRCAAALARVELMKYTKEKI